MFTVMFVGGAMVTLADFAALRWLGLREALRNPTQLKAAGRAFAWLVAVPWPAIAATFLLAMAVQDETAGALIFGLWFAGCLFYDLLLKIASVNWLRSGLRRRLSEGQFRQPS